MKAAENRPSRMLLVVLLLVHLFLVLMLGMAPFRASFCCHRGATQSEAEPALSSSDKKDQRRAAAAKRRQTAPLRQVLKRAEKSMEALESACQEIDANLNDPALYEADQKDQLQTLLQRQGELRKQLETAEQSWLEAQEALDEAESAA